jgi:hypothetical protein
MNDPIPPDQMTVVPANEATWHDLVGIFGTDMHAVTVLARR